MKLSEALYVKRCESNKTQKQVCAIIGVSEPTYCFLETGKYPYKRLIPKVVGKLSHYLEKSPIDVMLMFKEDKK